MSRRSFTIAAIILGVSGAASAMEPIPDLIGSWTGTIVSLRHGQKFEHSEGPAQIPSRVEIDFTMKIDGQDGPVFSGTWTSPRASDPLVGTFRGDGKRILMVDNDGAFSAEMTGSDSMEICRTEVTDHSMVVSCGNFARKK